MPGEVAANRIWSLPIPARPKPAGNFVGPLMATKSSTTYGMVATPPVAKTCASKTPAITATCPLTALSHLVLPTPMPQVQNPQASPSTGSPVVAQPAAVFQVAAVSQPRAAAGAVVVCTPPAPAVAAVALPMLRRGGC